MWLNLQHNLKDNTSLDNELHTENHISWCQNLQEKLADEIETYDMYYSTHQHL